ncbi:hypothetical protein C8P68_103379 [Mucilaginibacter yixingensis]|uniref:Uncharacterized protein n=1 Tax=Mucilaginibacter yixingensis TaxID=1295612 RepID=A0A2T5JBH4_9SPHI|nr:hypothetical protein [Mucilaginibacter yixingensis]PTQ98218.1 hypothetical protein C8P68_103379 [Mucilaginibacter yixingensis]
MATLINTPAVWTAQMSTEEKVTVWTKLVNFVATQKQNHTLWFFINLVVQGVLVLPIPVALIYYFNAPDWVLAVTMICFFANIIVNMGGEGIKTTIGFFAASIAIHLIMILAFVL